MSGASKAVHAMMLDVVKCCSVGGLALNIIKESLKSLVWHALGYKKNHSMILEKSDKNEKYKQMADKIRVIKCKC